MGANEAIGAAAGEAAAPTPAPPGRRWFLEGVAADGSHTVHEVAVVPFRVGREATNELALQAPGMSRQHAVIVATEDGRLRLTDLGSTNGTYVNRVRLAAARVLEENDVIHFGNAEFRLGVLGDSSLPTTLTGGDRTMIAPAGAVLSGHFVPHEKQLRELLAGTGLGGAVQPIVRAQGGERFALELLGRSSHPDLPASPVHLFALAARMGREAELSTAFRNHGVRTVAQLAPGTTLFVNTHPQETFDPAFLEALSKLPHEGLDVDLVIEVHETAVMEVERMRELAARLADLKVRFAYDDFGAGQARLNELAEVPAHFVKFDFGLVHGLHEASTAKQKLVADLVRMVKGLGSMALAEGVETDAEAEVCRQIGFDLLQGYLTGRPAPLDSLRGG
ncbi:MAG: EAL domain-containing protein [Rubrivivax sp.]|nr:EAL domain-containing protein [Rubrivivax sp.]